MKSNPTNSASTPRFSILTPSYNQGVYIEDCLTSVALQTEVISEHVVADGGSTDDTVAILARHARAFSSLKFTSYRDRGQADALNRAFGQSRGEIVGWVNSDDYYLPGILQIVDKMFRDPSVMWLIGNLVERREPEGVIHERAGSNISYKRLLENPDIVRQPAAFYRRSAIEAVGGWDDKLHMVMDYDLWIRLARRWEPKHIDRASAVFRIHSSQKTSNQNIRLQMKEISSILRREKVGLCRLARFRATREIMILRKTVKALLLKGS
jgi:glycosyltransferase involved in cell wall biosynthesis